MVEVLNGAVGVAIATTELAWRTQFHHARLVEHVTPFNGFNPGPAMRTIAAAVTRQAAILSYLDVYLVLALSAIVVAPLALFLPKMPKGATVGH